MVLYPSSTDSAYLNYASVQPNTNPLYVDLVASGRDFVPANTFVNKLNSISDPRRAKYFTNFSRFTYKGGVYGGLILMETFLILQKL
jgi:hypothetical protein